MFCAFSKCLDFFRLPPTPPKVGDGNLMQEVNQNLAEEVRSVAFQKFISVV